MNFNVNCELWATVMCQCMFISYKKWITLVGKVDRKGGCACVGSRVYVYGKSLYFPLSYAVNIKWL